MVDTPVLRMFRSRLLHAPWWVLALAAGLPFGVVMGVFAGLRTGDPLFGLFGGLFGGVLFGLVMGVVLARINGRARAALGPIPPERLREVVRAAHRGPVPQDPAVRGAALRMASHQLTELRRHRLLALVVFGFFAVLEAVAAILTGALHLWLFALLFVGLGALAPIQTRRLERRVALLSGTDPRPVE